MKKTQGTYKWKMAGAFAALFIVVLAAVGYFILSTTQASLYQARYKEMRFTAGRITDTLALAGDDEMPIADRFAQVVSLLLTEGGTAESLQIAFLNAEGQELYTRGNIDPGYAVSVTVLAAMTGLEMSELEIHSVNGIMMGDYGRPLNIGNETYLLFLRQSVEDITETMQTNTMTVLVVSAVAGLLAIIIAFLIALAMTGPIVRLTKKTKQLAGGNFAETDLQPERDHASDEIEELEDNFNVMARELNAILSKTNSEKNKLSTIFQHMADGLVVYDSNGNVVQSNIVAEQLLGSAVATEAFAETFPKENFKKLLNTPNGEVFDRTVERDEHFIHMEFASYQNEEGTPEGLIVVLSDVTAEQRAHEMQREFVANVSHELRTPITTVKSYVETMMDGMVDDPETQKSFLQTINQESDRMNSLISDLLELSRIDNRQVQLKTEPLNLSSLLADCVKRHLILAEKKGQTMQTMELPEAYILGDRARLEQVIGNLLVNAVNYSPERATISAWVDVNEADREVALHIRDTGMGIPYHEQTRIFERFYRIDKARSRSGGGTGLGLSIAKELMEMHHGRIEVVSVPGHGSTFHLIFPAVLDEDNHA